MATRMKDKDWEQMVLGYLRTKGYKQAEDMFRQESKTQSLEQMAFNVDSNPSLTNYISFYNPNEANAAAYEESFGALRNWAHNSLDLYRVSRRNED
jgi:hypothetical protein